MKKFLVFAILACLLTGFAFADKGFTVQEVKGKVEREASNQKVEVKAGDLLGDNALISTAIGASVVLKDSDGKTFTINSRQNGKVADLINSSTNIRIGGNISRTDTGSVSRTITQSGTASARASDQAADDAIDAE